MLTEIETEFGLCEEVAFIRTVAAGEDGRVISYVGVGVIVCVTGSLIDAKAFTPGFERPEFYMVKAGPDVLTLPRAALRHQAHQAVAESMVANAWMFEPQETKPAEVKP